MMIWEKGTFLFGQFWSLLEQGVLYTRASTCVYARARTQ